MTSDRFVQASDGTRVLARRARSRPPTVETRDFRAPPRPYRRVARELEGIAEGFSVRFKAAIANSLRLHVEVASESVAYPSFRGAVEEIPERSWAEPIAAVTGDRGVIMFDGEIQESLITRLLGSGPVEADDDDGESAEPDPEAAHAGEPKERLFSFGALSRSVMRPAFAAVLRELNGLVRYNSTTLYEVDSESGRLGLRRFMRSSDPVVVMTYRVSSEHVSGRITVLLQVRSLAQLLKRDQSPPERAADDPTRRALEGAVRDVNVALTAEVGRAGVAIQEYLRLQPGDTLVLDQRVDDPLTISVAGRALFTGRPGRAGDRMAVRIMEATDRVLNER